MQTLPNFPNPERVAMNLLSSVAPAYTKLPSPIAPSLPLIRVHGLGGPMDIHNYYARLSIEIFAADYDTAWNLAGTAAQVVIAAYNKMVDGDLIDHGIVPNGLQAPFYSQDTFRVQFEATLIMRRSAVN